MSEQRDEHEAEVEDLDVVADEAEHVKGGDTTRRPAGTAPKLSDIKITKPIDKSSPIL
jgi:type VI protein secretion system component Hcp